MIVVQVEHIDSVNNIESILSYEEVNAYFIGPYDLSASLGCPGQFDHPNMVEAINKVREAGRSNKKPGGLHIIEPVPDELKKRIDEGFLFLAYSTDIRVLDSTFRKGLEGIW